MNTFIEKVESHALESPRTWSDPGANGMRQGILMLAGTAAAVYGVWRRDWAGRILALGGASLASAAAIKAAPALGSCVVSYTINRSVGEIFSFVRNPNNWPAVLKGLEAAREVEPQAIAWGMKDGTEGRVQIIREIPDKYLRWRSSKSGVQHEAALELRAAPGNRGTELVLSIRWIGRKNVVQQMIQSARGKAIEQYAREGLRALKQVLEAGEIPTTEGQPHGARGSRGKAMRVAFRESRREGKAPAREPQGSNEQLAAS